jgi:hypothetical protein
MHGHSFKWRRFIPQVPLLRIIGSALLIVQFVGLNPAGGWGGYLPPGDRQFPVQQLQLVRGGRTGPQISLAGAGNEYLVLHFSIPGADLSSFQVQAKGPGAGKEIGFRFSQLRWAPAASRGRFAPDALTPVDQGLTDTGAPLEIWATIKIAAGAKAGRYAPEIVFSDNKGVYKQPLELRVWNFSLPPDLPISILGHLWGDKNWFARYGVNSSSQFDAVIKAYLRSMREYKINALGPQLYRFPVAQLVPGKKVEDFPEYHSLISYALNDLGYRLFCLPPLDKKQHNLKDPNSQFMRFAPTFYPLFKDYVTRHGWQNRALIKIVDEPKLETYPDVIDVYAKVQGLAPGIRTICAGREPDLRFVKVINIWMTAAMFFDPAKIAAAQKAGQEIWLYVNRFHRLNQPLVSQRLIGWFLYRHKFSGYSFWSVNYWDQDPWTEGDGSASRFPLRGGVLYYPNPKNGLPIPTTRLEAIRCGLQDFQYLTLLDQARERGQVDAKTFEEIQRGMEGVTGGLKHGMPQITMATLEKLRYRMGEILNQAGR